MNNSKDRTKMSHFSERVVQSDRKEIEGALKEKIKPELFIDDCGRVGNKYTSGAYGDHQITSFHSPRCWKNEWEVIPENQKKELVDWINSKLDLDDMFYNQSLVVQSTNPITEYLAREKILPDVIELHEMPGLYDIPKDKINKHKEAKPFMEAFIHHKENSIISIIFQPKILRIGFAVNDYEEIHVISFATLSPVWKLKSQKELIEMTIDEKLKSSYKDDEYLEKMFRTTAKHSFGMYWAGILTLNVPKMSTIINGIQHALKLKIPRYKIEWVNLKNPRNRIETLYEITEISAMIENKKIEETDGSEKAPKIYPETCQVDYRCDK